MATRTYTTGRAHKATAPAARCRVRTFLEEDGRFDLSAIMTDAHDRRFNAALRGRPITFREALRAAWSRAKEERSIAIIRADLAAQAARGVVFTVADLADNVGFNPHTMHSPSFKIAA